MCSVSNLQNIINRNTDEINKDLYNTSISSNIQASIDTRLFTTQGRNGIKDDINKATAITNALSTIMQTGDLNFNQEVGQNYNTYQTNKALGENLINILENDNLSIAEKENFLAQFTKNLAKSNGYDLENLQIKFINDTDAIGADNQNFKGNYNSKTNTITLNLANISNLSDFTNTLGHEFTHAITNSKNKFAPQDAAQNNYADLKGNLFTNYLNKALDIQGNSIDLSNSNVNLDFSNPNNINALINNQGYFNSMDKSRSDNLDLNFFNIKEDGSTAIIASLVGNFEGKNIYTVGAHGSALNGGTIRDSKTGNDLNANGLVEKIVNSQKYQSGNIDTIALLSCFSGTDTNDENYRKIPNSSLGQQVANLTGKTVVAFDGAYQYNPWSYDINGKITLGPGAAKNTKIKVFYPQNSKIPNKEIK